MDMEKVMNQEALEKIEGLFTNSYNELYDSLFYYMKVYVEHGIQEIFLRDEIENYIGLTDHMDIVNYIMSI